MGVVSGLKNYVRTSPWLGRIALRTIPDFRWQVSIKPLGEFQIRLRQNRSYWLRSPLSHEGFMLEALHRLVHPGDVVYDIGANIGLYSRFLVQMCRASEVYAFEPMSGNLSLLKRNLEIGGCTSTVVLMPIAVGSEDGTAKFQVDDISSATGVLDAVTKGQACRSRHQYGLPPICETVQVARLDTLLLDQKLTLPNVLKIDIEGAEAMALCGAVRLLRERRPRLVIELHGANAAREVLTILWGFGYHCFGYLETSGTLDYHEITQKHLPQITERYSLHFIAASCQEDELLHPIDGDRWK
jgi:FkbM family methyltransferase